MQDLPLSLYLHIPFCRSKCTYCAFNTYVNMEALVQPFTEALIEEIRITGHASPYGALHTIFFGGGTPSQLSSVQFDAILCNIRESYNLLPDAEITIEANPNDLDEAYLSAIFSVGINRLSLGMQSADATELSLFGRRHDNDIVAHSVTAARRAGFQNINLDLIYGVPHQTLASWCNSIEQAIALRPEHLSLYALSLEEGTSMADWVARGRLPVPDDDLAADMYELATEMLDTAGYHQYEISNWSLPGLACRHNLQYWRNWPYVGLGPGAHGFASGVRYDTILAPQQYIHVMQHTDIDYIFPRTPATRNAVVVDYTNDIAETLIMGLRLLDEGINRNQFRIRFEKDLLEIHGPTIERYVGHGLLSVDEQRVVLTQRGRLLSNMIFRELV